MFTTSSAPEETAILSVHIQASGNWTVNVSSIYHRMMKFLLKCIVQIRIQRESGYRRKKRVECQEKSEHVNNESEEGSG